MNGECIKYASLKNPMSWEDFKKLPEDLAVQYVKSLRKKYNVPNNALANMFGVDPAAVSVYFKSVGLFIGSGAGGKRTWDKDGFLAWCGGAEDGVVKPSETPVEKDIEDVRETPVEEESSAEEIEEATDEIIVVNEEQKDLREQIQAFADDCEANPVDYIAHTIVPERGQMTFKGNIDDILRTISKLLDGQNVTLDVQWGVHVQK